MKKKEEMKLLQAIRMHLRGAKLLHSVSKTYFVIATLYAVVNAVTPYATVFFSARILSELALLRRADVLWHWVIVGVAAVGALSLLKAWLYQRSETLMDDLYGRKEQLFIRKMFSLDYSEMDKQDNRDLRAQIKEYEQWSGWGLMRLPDIWQNALGSIFGILSGTALTVSLFTSSVPEGAGWLTVLNNPLFMLLLAGIMVGVSLLAGIFSAKSLVFWSMGGDEATLGNRIFGFFGYLSNDKGRAADIRIYDQQRLVTYYWETKLRNMAFCTKGLMGRLAAGPHGLYGALGVSVTALITGFIYVFTCLKAWGGAFDVGSIMQYVGAATALAGNIFALTTVLGHIRTNAGFLEPTFKFLDLPNNMYQGSLTTEKRSDRQYEVEFRNVSFKYPESENWALKNVSMKFKVGKRLAIVGENGSGKSTFIKLLCRLYDPQEGQILLNGIDIRKYNYRDYMNVFSVVFQDFQLLSQSLGSNVAGSMEYDRRKVEKALIDAGFGERLGAMEKGLDTMLYKDFAEDGVNVSGGEAQKIAIARALYKDAPFIILDEPTAALDPIAEAEIYSKFNDIVGDKTAIYISHRLSSCKFCDEIAVFHNGELIQSGTHDGLLSDENGKYHALWNAQAQYYTAENAG